MKVIDLLNKIANGEEVPEKINYNGILYTYNEGIDYTSQNGYLIGGSVCISPEDLNDKVKIIEEHNIPDKIKMRVDSVGDINNKIENLNLNQMIIEDKINEILDYLEEIE